MDQAIVNRIQQDPDMSAFLSFQKTQNTLLNATANHSPGLYIWAGAWKNVTDQSSTEYRFPDGSVIVTQSEGVHDKSGEFFLWVTLPTGKSYAETVRFDGVEDGSGAHTLGPWSGTWVVTEMLSIQRQITRRSPWGHFQSFRCRDCFETGGMNYAGEASRLLELALSQYQFRLEEKSLSYCPGCRSDTWYSAAAVLNEETRLKVEAENPSCDLSSLFDMLQSAPRILNWDRFAGTAICDRTEHADICDFRQQ